MNLGIKIIAVTLLIVSCNGKQKPNTALSPELSEVSKWFSAWELVSNQIYQLKKYESVDFVFFDEKYVYSTSPVTVSDGIAINGPSLLGKDFVWKKKEHRGNITLPSGDVAPLGLMVFASPLETGQKKSFFIMPLPDFWKSAGVKSKIAYDLFLTGVFLHEFSHSQQMTGIGAKISELSENVSFKEELNDEIVEQLFSNDSSYVAWYKLEHSKVFEAVGTDTNESRARLTQEILNSIRSRQGKYFVGDYAGLTDLNALFMTMEGVGQYNMYAWLTHPEGGKLDKAVALDATRTKSWIQDEGFGLALLLSEFEDPQVWGSQVFGDNSNTLIDLIENVIKKQ
ncbi:MAG: hypothetical protein R2819_10960 [Allomuricauda sp.]